MGTPPCATAEITPTLPPPQGILVAVTLCQSKMAGCETVMMLLPLHPLASVTEMVYTPAIIELKIFEACAGPPLILY